MVDDQAPAFSGEIYADVRDEEGVAPRIEHINPSDYFKGSRSSQETVDKILGKVGETATQFWDVVVIDLFLGDFGLPTKENLEMPLRIAESVRIQNQSTAVLLYSGTLAKYLEDLFGQGASDTQLRRVFQASIANFVPRNRVAREVASAAENPSWLLQVDRLLMRHEKLTVRPEEAKFRGRTFAELAASVRRQDRDGQEITRLAAEYGISSFFDLNS